jgi:hypothetical protein
MRSDDVSERPEKPEPEIIPPDRPGARSHVWVSIDANGRRGVYIGKPGPLNIALALFVIGLIIGAILILFLGFVLLAIPIVVLIALILVASALFRPKPRGRVPMQDFDTWQR